MRGRNCSFSTEMSRFKFVTFDVTHTLLQFRAPVSQVYSEAASKYGLENVLNRNENMEASFRKHFKSMLNEYPNFGAGTRVSSEQWWSFIVERTLRDNISDQSALDPNTLNQICAHLFRLYSQKECWSVLPGVTGLLGKLKKRDVKLGVISNFDERLEQVLKSNKLNPYFDVVLASYCVNAEKPNKEIFDMALRKMAHLNIQPSEALHIGDNVELDYNGARNAGWNALLLLDPNQDNSDKDKYQSAYSVVDIEKNILV